MADTKKIIKTWLKENNLTREWLAEQTGSKIGTVNNWLSTSIEIPAAKLALIDRMMIDHETQKEHEALKALPTNQIFSVEVDLETFRRYNRAALAAGMTIEDWIKTVANEASDHEQLNEPDNSYPLVAEPPAEYKAKKKPA